MTPPAGIALTLATEPDPAIVDALGEALATFNESAAGPAESRPLWIIARDPRGHLAGGLRGQTFWHWLFVAWLWVDEAQRRQGLGAALLHAAEDEARRRGCIGAYVDTYSFQAPGFYARQGYTPFGRLDDLPPGGFRTWFAKRL
ncbi:GNAT family N-acetyltransferase [Elioraea sp.]|uniref:GNAT family N-acetyltransferase n=1 Tax=Elioraea sp. TaxID=2185103 RepID=UPI003F7002E9